MKKTIKLLIILSTLFVWCSNIFATETITFTWQISSNLVQIGETDYKFRVVTVGATNGQQYTIDWGDGSALETKTAVTSTSVPFEEIAHTYTDSGTYDVIITGVTDNCHFTVLDLWKSGTTAVNVSGLTQLTLLGLTENPLITTVDASGCSSLQELFCEGTPENLGSLATLNLTGAIELRKLYCGGNKLTELNLSGLTKLTELSCPVNKLTELNVSSCTALTLLVCEMNELTQLDASNLAALVDLRCNHNYLTTLNVSGCTSLRQLFCYNDSLQTLDVNGLTQLVRLWSYNNKLTSLNASGCTNLQQLQTNFNNLTQLDVSGCASLNELDCGDNNLTQLDVSDCDSLITFRCYNNELTTLNIEGLTRIMLLHCFNNHISELDITALSNLESLDCNTNEISYLNVSNCNNLLETRCYDNHLQLANLYDISKKTQLPNYRQLGTQTLPLKKVKPEGVADFSTQKEFDGLATVFVVEKDSSLAELNTDYTIADGLITFLSEGDFQITMTNDSISSFSYRPAKVIAYYNVDANNEDVGIEGVKTFNVAVYPNPTKGLLTIKTGVKGIDKINIYNTFGSKVYTIADNAETIDISHLPAGIYFLKIADKTVKVVKQ